MPTLDPRNPILFCGNEHIETVESRIHHKMRNYTEYNFTTPQSYALNVFFDLAQEFEDSTLLHLLSVLLLRVFFNVEAELFLKNGPNTYSLYSPKIDGVPPPMPNFFRETAMHDSSWCDADHCYLPLHGKSRVFLPKDQRIVAEESLLGVMVAYPKEPLQSHDMLFLEKYANRVGFCLHNRLLAEQHMRHILFVRKLAHDIGHNVITPNMQFKLMLSRLEEQVRKLETITPKALSPDTHVELASLQKQISDQTRALVRHFKYGALFLESLLRQSHFDEGHYVLRLARLDLCRLVILPQFERYRAHLEERGIYVAKEQPLLPSEPCMAMVDMGLISQVLANLLSNAVKYCAPSASGKPAEARCSVELVPNSFPDGVAGLKVSVFTTGPCIAERERDFLFEDSFRASNVNEQHGSGHGLFFTREIVAEHGGKAGYESHPDGNIFYFTLPLG